MNKRASHRSRTSAHAAAARGAVAATAPTASSQVTSDYINLAAAMSSTAAVASKPMAAPLRSRGAASRRRSSPVVRSGAGGASGKTAVSKHDVPPTWSTDTSLRKSQKVSLEEGDKLT